MKKNPFGVLGLVLTAAGAIIAIAQGIVNEKQQKETIKEEVRKAFIEQNN